MFLSFSSLLDLGTVETVVQKNYFLKAAMTMAVLRRAPLHPCPTLPLSLPLACSLVRSLACLIHFSLPVSFFLSFCLAEGRLRDPQAEAHPPPVLWSGQPLGVIALGSLSLSRHPSCLSVFLKG